MESLFAKYNVPAPRYTSYPTVPYWDKEPLSPETWKKHVQGAFRSSQGKEGISLYIHLPYCESLCTYCGCNTRITVNHAVEGPYIDALLKEWAMYREVFGANPTLQEIHLGGGTPTFFSPHNLTRLIQGILADSDVAPHAEFGFEGHPNNTTPAHLQALYDLGFRRVSYGIQDFDPKVQEIVNRIQPFETVQAAVSAARAIGYSSVNVDLIFGLPFQTQDSIRDTFQKVGQLRPDRIAYYSYAHVPWIKPGQRRFTEMDLPTGEEKRKLYELGRELLEGLGYLEIGMDHFALPQDGLYKGFLAGEMHRNFMGYTPAHTQLLVGLGVSSIGDAWTAFAQNLKTVEEYLQAIGEGKIPIFRGHALTPEDLILRRHILNLMCRFETRWDKPTEHVPFLEGVHERLETMAQDGLVELIPSGLRVLPAGRPFLRNACMALDARLHAEQPSAKVFSSAV